MIGTVKSIMIAFATAAANHTGEAESPLHVGIRVDAQEVDMGRSLVVDVVARDAEDRPVTDCLLLPYVNERRWGAHEVTDRRGSARIILPLPNPGPARIVIRAVPNYFDTCWIWCPRSASKTAYLLKRFTIDSPVNEADLRVAVKDHAKVYLNDTVLGEASGVQTETRVTIPGDLLKEGENALAVEAFNNDGMAAVALQLRVRTTESAQIIVTDRGWNAWEQPPAGWPAVADTGAPVRVLARLLDGLVTSPAVESWPGNIRRDDLFAGRPLPKNAVASEAVTVQVVRRAIVGRRDPEHLVGMQWGSYFFPGGFYWQTAHAVPLTGFYDTSNPDVIRQQALWFMDMGVDFLVADWPVYIPPDKQGRQRWKDRNEFGVQQVRVTAKALEGLARLRDEGYPVPAMVIMAFLANGPANSKETVNEELEWLYDRFIRNPRFHDLWLMYEGKPLVAVLYTGGKPADELPGPPIDSSRFTVRYVGTQLQVSHVDRLGYWSWMDGSAEPVVTYRNGKAEAVTPTPAYFDLVKGWKGPDARGRRNGTTFLRSFRPALEHRPRFVVIHQWNEFTGQAEGYPCEGGLYGDSYSVELSDDIEPTSLTMAGYRGDSGGWGFFYVNLTQAVVDLLKQPSPSDTVLAVYPPQPGAVVSGDNLQVGWEFIGKPPTSFTILVDGAKVAEGIQGGAHTLDLTALAPGRHTVTVVAEGATTHYHLAHDRIDERLRAAAPVRVEVPFLLARGASE